MNEQDFRSRDTRGTKSFSEKLDDVTKIAISPGNAHADHYLRGMANGLILAQTIYNDAEPKYIEADAVKQFDYVAEATLTLSNKFHGELVSKAAFTKAMNDSIHALTQLDKVKKSLFYGRDNNLVSDGLRDTSDLPTLVSGLNTNDTENLIHGIVGLATEAGELLELLRDTLNGKTFDRANLQEEVGDGKWYMAILAKVGQFVWGDDEKVNIRKLRARFPNAFTEYDAVNRDLIAERAILEGDAANQLALPISHRDAPMPGERQTNVGISETSLDRYEAGGGYIPKS